jgi:probable phosphoglycerate mutase
MKKIFLVRHGESEWNKLKMIQGQSDLPLLKGLKAKKLI